MPATVKETFASSISLDPDDYCHLIRNEKGETYCGGGEYGPECDSYYKNESICPSCGLPTCPICATMEVIDWVGSPGAIPGT